MNDVSYDEQKEELHVDPYQIGANKLYSSQQAMQRDPYRFKNANYEFMSHKNMDKIEQTEKNSMIKTLNFSEIDFATIEPPKTKTERFFNKPIGKFNRKYEPLKNVENIIFKSDGVLHAFDNAFAAYDKLKEVRLPENYFFEGEYRDFKNNDNNNVPQRLKMETPEEIQTEINRLGIKDGVTVKCGGFMIKEAGMTVEQTFDKYNKKEDAQTKNFEPEYSEQTEIEFLSESDMVLSNTQKTETNNRRFYNDSILGESGFSRAKSHEPPEKGQAEKGIQNLGELSEKVEENFRKEAGFKYGSYGLSSHQGFYQKKERQKQLTGTENKSINNKKQEQTETANTYKRKRVNMTEIRNEEVESAGKNISFSQKTFGNSQTPEASTFSNAENMTAANNKHMVFGGPEDEEYINRLMGKSARVHLKSPFKREDKGKDEQTEPIKNKQEQQGKPKRKLSLKKVSKPEEHTEQEKRAKEPEHANHMENEKPWRRRSLKPIEKKSEREIKKGMER